MGYLYRSEFPPYIKIHNVLHTDYLRKTPMNLLPNQEKAPKPPVIMKG